MFFVLLHGCNICLRGKTPDLLLPCFLHFNAFSGKKKRITLIFGLLVLFRVMPSSSQPPSSTPIFNSYETSNYAAIQVAFHKTQYCPLEHGVLCELKGQAACFQVEQIQMI